MFDIEALVQAAFSWKTALSLCVASQLAYSDKANVISTAQGWGFDDVLHLSSDDTQAFVATTSDIALLAFRGTESAGDWITNIRIIGKNRPYGRVHKGFYRAFKDVRDAVRNCLTDGQYRHLYFCGHSLGGALATIAILETADIAADYKAGYTYGQPKTGKSNFRDHFNEYHGDQFFRFVNDGDIVPRVPPAYRHVRVLHQLSDESGLEAIPVDTHDLSDDEFKALQDELESAIRQYQSQDQHLEGVGAQTEDEYLEGIIPGVAAHDMELYISRIKERLDNE